MNDFKEEVDTRCGDMEKFVGGFDERLTKLEQVLARSQARNSSKLHIFHSRSGMKSNMRGTMLFEEDLLISLFYLLSVKHLWHHFCYIP